MAFLQIWTPWIVRYWYFMNTQETLPNSGAIRPTISRRTCSVQRCRNVENRSNYINTSTKNCITEIEMFCSETKQTDIETRSVSSRQAADVLCRLSNWWSIGHLDRDYFHFLPKEGKAVRSVNYLIKEPPLRKRAPLTKSHIKNNQ